VFSFSAPTLLVGWQEGHLATQQPTKVLISETSGSPGMICSYLRKNRTVEQKPKLAAVSPTLNKHDGLLSVLMPMAGHQKRQQTFPGVLSDFQHLLSGTRRHKQFWSATLCLFLNLDLKLFYSLRLSLNTDPTCRQRLWRYDHMALYKFDYLLLLLLFNIL